MATSWCRSTLMAIGSRRWLDMRLRVVSALVALAFVICPVAATARSAGDLDSISYHVLKGDTLYLLAERFLKTRSSYAVLQRINGISDPRQLPIGSVLRIPRSLLRQQPTQEIGRAHSELQSLMRLSYAVFCLK